MATYLFVICLWNSKLVLRLEESNALFLQQQPSRLTILERGEPAIPLRNSTANELQNRRRQTLMRFAKPVDDRMTTAIPPEERAPAFIIIGSQKGGTRALNSYLSQHPLIEMPTDYDEPHFFDLWWPDRSPKENLNMYIEKYFERDCRQASPACVAGESTPIYLYDTPAIPARLKQTCPWVKLIVLLRDPVKRAYSQYTMLFENDLLDVTFEEHLKLDFEWMNMVGLANTTLSPEEEDVTWNKYLMHPTWERHVLGRGMYEIQLRTWFRYFGRSQFLVLKSQDLDVNREATLKRVYEFLGVPYVTLNIQEKVHVRNYTRALPKEIERRLYDFYRPYNERLALLLGPEWRGVFEKET